MTMDDFELQRRMKHAVQGAEPDSAQLWENVMNESAHARNVRNAKRTAITLTVLAFAVAVPVAIGMLSGDDGGFAGRDPSPTGPPPTTATATPVAMTPTYIDTELNVAFSVPKGWRVSEFEGHRTVVPKGLPMPPQDGDTAVLQTTFGDLAPTAGRTDATFAGHPAEEVSVEEDGRYQEWVVVDWPASPLCDACEDGAITIWWEGSTRELWDEHQDGFETLVSSFRPLFDEDGELTELENATISTRRGNVSGAVDMNAAVATVVKFFDDRVWMTGDYSSVLSEEGEAAYLELDLGPECADEARLEPIECMPGSFEPQTPTFTITSSEAADANSFEIVAEISYTVYHEADNSSTFTVAERMFVGPGTSLDGESRDFVIRGAVDEA